MDFNFTWINGFLLGAQYLNLDGERFVFINLGPVEIFIELDPQ